MVFGFGIMVFVAGKLVGDTFIGVDRGERKSGEKYMKTIFQK